MSGASLRVLAVDDERPALEELCYLLRHDPRVDEVRSAGSAAAALRMLERHDVDAVFLDIRMPGLTGLDVARVLARFKQPPLVVFVTAYDDHAVHAFDLDAVDYVLKPVHADRLSEAVRRVQEARQQARDQAEPDDDETIQVELGGVTRFIRRSEVTYAEAHGDYVRLHTAEANHLVRIPLSTLEERWADAGFIRIHRRFLVSLGHVSEVRKQESRYTVVIGGTELQVSRRHTPQLRERLKQQSRPDGAA